VLADSHHAHGVRPSTRAYRCISNACTQLDQESSRSPTGDRWGTEDWPRGEQADALFPLGNNC